MAEVIKYAFISDRSLFELLQTDAPDMEEVIRLCVEDKRALVEADETDKGARQLLNLGHTMGHGVEALSEFTIMHGEAVAIGMAMAARAAVKLGLCPKEDCDALLAMLQHHGLPVSSPYSAEDIYRKALSDKKRKGGTINLVVPYGIADSRLYPCSVENVLEFIRLGL
jgi:3-dehydroquinate synthase